MPGNVYLRVVDGQMEKRCVKCDEFWPATREFFTTHPMGALMLDNRCNACRNEYRKQRQLELFASEAPR